MKGKLFKFLPLLLLVVLVVIAFVAVPVEAKSPQDASPPNVQAAVLQAEDPVADGIDLEVFFADARVKGIPLTAIVFAIVAFLKQVKVKGHWLTVASFIIGTAIGILYLYSIEPMVGFVAWLGAIAYGLLLGALASGTYIGIRSASTPSGTSSG